MSRSLAVALLPAFYLRPFLSVTAFASAAFELAYPVYR